jgi:hypothetical protein
MVRRHGTMKSGALYPNFQSARPATPVISILQPDPKSSTIIRPVTLPCRTLTIASSEIVLPGGQSQRPRPLPTAPSDAPLAGGNAPEQTLPSPSPALQKDSSVKSISSRLPCVQARVTSSKSNYNELQSAICTDVSPISAAPASELTGCPTTRTLNTMLSL